MVDPAKQKFLYDIIMVKTTFDMPEELSNRTYRVRLFNEFIDLPVDRHYQDKFPEIPLGEFDLTPCDLINKLSFSGICLTVREKSQLKGSGRARMESHNLIAMADKTYEIVAQFEIQLIFNGRKVDKVTIKVLFKSTDPDLDMTHYIVGCYDICRPLERVTMGDMMFTLGRSRTCATTTAIKDERLMSPATGAPFTSTFPYKPYPDGEDGCACVLKGVQQPPDLDASKEHERELLKSLLTELAIDP